MIKIGIADKDQFFQDSIKLFCQSSNGQLDLVFSTTLCNDLVEEIANYRVDILIIDMDFPLDLGLEICKKIREKFPQIKILGFSKFNDKSMIAKIFQSGGVHGYLEKNQGFQLLFEAINQLISTGYFYIYDMVELLAFSQHTAPAVTKQSVPVFSARQIEIAELTRQEFTAKEIARKLGITPKAVEKQKSLMTIMVNCKKFHKVIEHMLENGILK